MDYARPVRMVCDTGHKGVCWKTSSQPSALSSPLRLPSPDFSYHYKGPNCIPVLFPKEVGHELGAPIFRYIFLLAILRPDRVMNVVAEFVIEDPPEKNVPEQRQPE